MRKIIILIAAMLTLLCYCQVFADAATGSGSMLRKFQPEQEIVEIKEIKLYDDDGLFLDEIEPGFFKNRGWEEIFVTGGPNIDYMYQDGSRIHFDLPHKEIYAYAMNKADPAADMYVETEFTIDEVYTYRATYGVACRVSDAGWYELRVQTTGDVRDMGSYMLYKYDPTRKSQKNLNPYVSLHPNTQYYKTTDLKNGYGKTNVIGMSCVGDRIRVFINGKEQNPIRGLIWSDSQFSWGGFGFGVQTYGYGDSIAKIDVNYTAAELQ